MKRADVPITLYFRMFEIVLLALVIVIVSTEVGNIRDSGVYQKKFIARDFALVLDSVTNARGNLWYAYNPPLQALGRFTVDLRNGQVAVDNERWPYAVSKRIRFVPQSFVQQPGFVLQKTGNELTIVPQAASALFNGMLLDCPAAGVELKTLILDPGHGYNAATKQGEQGLTGNFADAQGRKIPESELMLKTAVALDSQLKARGFKNILGTRALEAEMLSLPETGAFLAEEARTTQERVELIAKNPDAVVLSLHAGKHGAGNNFIKAYVNKDSGAGSAAFACRILNALATNYPLDITGTAIIPVDLAQLSPDDPRQVLLKDRVGVQLELGSLDVQGNKVLANPQSLAEALAGGVLP